MRPLLTNLHLIILVFVLLRILLLRSRGAAGEGAYRFARLKDGQNVFLSLSYSSQLYSSLVLLKPACVESCNNLLSQLDSSLVIVQANSRLKSWNSSSQLASSLLLLTVRFNSLTVPSTAPAATRFPSGLLTSSDTIELSWPLNTEWPDVIQIILDKY